MAACVAFGLRGGRGGETPPASATTRRYYTDDQLEAVLEVNYLKFLARAVADRTVFARLWKQALDRLLLLGERQAARGALRQAAGLARSGGPRVTPEFAEDWFLALTNGSAAVFPGSGAGPAIVRSVERLAAPSAELLRDHCEVTLVAAAEESAAFRAARRFHSHRWRDRAE